jgi:hypothetical protein
MQAAAPELTRYQEVPVKDRATFTGMRHGPTGPASHQIPTKFRPYDYDPADGGR